MRAAELGMEAAAKRAGLARAEILTLSGILDANASGKEGFEMGPGAAFEVPLFGRHKGRLARAKAEIEHQARNYVAVRHRIDLEVRLARTALIEAHEALAFWRQRFLPGLEDNAARAQKANELGEVSTLAVLLARGLLQDARVQAAEAAAAVRRASAGLDRGIGKSAGRVIPAPPSRSEVP